MNHSIQFWNIMVYKFVLLTCILITEYYLDEKINLISLKNAICGLVETESNPNTLSKYRVKKYRDFNKVKQWFMLEQP